MPGQHTASCAHDHDCGEADCGLSYSLYKHIVLEKVSCLNEDTPGSCRNVFRPWDERLNFSEQPLMSDPDDPELLLCIPFEGQVKLKGISVVGGGEGRMPGKMRAFINQEVLDFGMVAGLAPVQEWDLVDNSRGDMEYPTIIPRFSGVHTLWLHFEEAIVGSQSIIQFVGMKGEFTERRREAVHAAYELKPIPDSSQVPGMDGNLSRLGQ